MRILGFLLGLVLVLAASYPASADDRRFLTNGNSGCFDCLGWYNPPEVQRLTLKAVWLWDYQQEPSGADILAAVAQGLDEYSETFHVLMLYTPGAPANIASGGLAFIYGTANRPGCGLGATACLPSYGRNLDIVYDSVSMSVWSLRSQTGVVLHELGHAMMDAGEMYRHTGGVIRCDNKAWTVMDCGLRHALFLQIFDRQTWALKHYPRPVTEYGFGRHPDGTPFVFWCNTDPRATRVAVLYDDGWGGAYWSGIHAPSASLGCVGAIVEEALGRCYLVKVETELSWRFTDGVQAGCVAG